MTPHRALPPVRLSVPWPRFILSKLELQIWWRLCRQETGAQIWCHKVKGEGHCEREFKNRLRAYLRESGPIYNKPTKNLRLILHNRPVHFTSKTQASRGIVSDSRVFLLTSASITGRMCLYASLLSYCMLSFIFLSNVFSWGFISKQLTKTSIM